MLKAILLLCIAVFNLPSSTPCVAIYGQCGGKDYKGATDCCSPTTCQYNNDYYSQCLPGTTKASSSTTKSPASSTKASTQCSAVYGQCGGNGWTGPQQCCSGSSCVVKDSYYSQCLPTSESTTTSKTTVKSSTGSSTTAKSSTGSSTTVKPTTTVGNDGRENGVTTRYWDCCKASCGWAGKASVTSPVKTCARDGTTAVGENTQSGCNGGSAYMCNNQQPWNVSSTLSYGYAAAYITNKRESDWCCACYSLVFTTESIIGKELIVQVTNTGGDLGNNHFDLQMPGGGVGIFDGCSSQFPEVSKSSWGQQYGGISSRTDCAKLPSVLRSGCLWRFDWFMNADNPKMRFKQVACPAALTANTLCSRK
ncbi:hypothetical protein I4U23_007059 [Adineta vaga]|nr:hypothetical protein I4U23_007059 [Adineta vaga]